VKTYQRKWQTEIPISLDEAWDFFSSPLNFAKIILPSVNVVVTSDYTTETKTYAGLLISYKVSPFLGIKLNWLTEITHVKEKEYFVDEQRFGPYALWHHQHHFKEISGGVQMTDILTYAIPYGVFGRLSNKMFVQKQLKEIFDYRDVAVKKLFGTM
jgi:ligand-binding SRPBCC domain-containing protein